MLSQTVQLGYKFFIAFLNELLTSPQLLLLMQIKALEMYTNPSRVWVNNTFFCDKVTWNIATSPPNLPSSCHYCSAGALYPWVN